MPEHHMLMGGKVHLYQRPRSSKWQCRAFLNGRDWRRSTGEDSLSHAKDIAEDWYFELRGKSRAGLLDVQAPRQTHTTAFKSQPRDGMTFAEAGEIFFREYKAINQGNISDAYIETMQMRFDVHLKSFFGAKIVTEITQGTVQEYRVHRQSSHTNKNTGKVHRPSRSTLKQEVVIVRHILSTAHQHGKLPSVPRISEPFKRSPKVDHLAWFSPEDYKRLYTATRERAKHPRKERYRATCEELHDFVLFLTNSGLRPSEAKKLKFRNCKIVTDKATGDRILDIHVVDGKRGVGRCLTMPGAVRPYERLFKRASCDPDANLFKKIPRILLNTVLEELGLKKDYQGKPRTAGSFRHSYFCFRILAGADKEELAKNGRTSVEMLDKYYLPHLQNYVDTAKINMKKSQSWGLEPS